MRLATVGLAAVLLLAVGHAAWSAEDAAPPAPVEKPAASPWPDAPAKPAAPAEPAAPPAPPATPAPSAPIPPPPAVAPKAALTPEQAYNQWLKAVRLIEINYLRGGDEKQWQAGRQEVLAIQDEAALGPLVQVLYGPSARNRGLLIEALGQFASHQSKVALAYLQEIAVGDASGSHRGRAVEALKAVKDKRPTERLLVHLALDEVGVFRDRAAVALAALDEKRAVRLMVERLTTEEVKWPVGADSVAPTDFQFQATGVPKFRHAVVQAAVPGGHASVIVDLPEADAVVIGTTAFDPFHRRLPPEVEVIITLHPDVLAALKTLTGKNFGYDKVAWTRWFDTPEGQKIIPPWEPISLTIQ